MISEIEKLLEVEIIVIPQIISDLTGHADGLVRFVDRTSILGNAREEECGDWVKGLNKILKEKGLNYVDIPWFEHKVRKNTYHSLGWYVNYLEVKNLIILPIFELPNNVDKEVYEIFCKIFPDRIIETLNYNSVALEGGLLNCTTWTIKT